MPVSTELIEQQRSIAEPADDEMFERKNFDRSGLRFEMADPDSLDIDTRYVEREDKSMIDPRTMEMPVGPTGMGEVGGGGMETIRLDGQRWPTYRYAHGFEMHREGGADDIERQRQYVMETFDYLFDLNFYFGMEGVAHWNGVFDEIRNRIDSDQVFDCEDYDGDSGDEDYRDVPEDLVTGDAMKATRGRVLDINDGWELAVGAHDALTELNYSAGETNSAERGPTFRERMQDADAVQNFTRMPYDLQPDYLPEDADNDIPQHMSYEFVDQSTAVDPSGEAVLGYDELFLLPDMDTVMTEFWNLKEMGTPEHYGPLEARQGKLAHDYINRQTVIPDIRGEYPKYDDIVYLKNVSALFGSQSA